MFKAACSCSKFQRFPVIIIMQKTIYQSSHETIATTNTVYNISYIKSATFDKVFAIVKDATPCVMIGIDCSAKRNDHFLASWKFFHHLITNREKCILIDHTISIFSIKCLWFDTKNFLAIFLIAKNYIGSRH